ncbi:MAG: DUF4278 domain-containing protein [Oculatellaceae cyanobacterium bins.114]|nr:DUF4278 domain-containing protein [Oculatellaceae cyanobacterium bins.114]
MYLIYRGVRYILTPSHFSDSRTAIHSFQAHADRMAAISPLVMCQYRGVSYARRVHDFVTPCPKSDPDLESFVAAFWEIINA